MSGSDYVIDTNVLIYLQKGVEGIDLLLEGKDIFVSFVTEMEMLSYSKFSADEIKKTKKLLDDCFIIELNNDIKSTAIELRRNYKFKLPDAIVAATAIFFQIPIITADKKFEVLTELDLLIIKV